jgi:DNA helicase II / ATP-dependent DNA helicase PcrA
MFEQILKSTAPRICVIAAPGSGKSKRVLIPKASQVLADTTIDPKNVLLLTFSRLSAKDLRARVAKLERIPRASTVHSLCLAFLLSEDSHGIRDRVESILLEFEKATLIADLKLSFPNVRKTALAKTLDAFAAGWAVHPHDEVFEEDEGKRNFKAAVVNWLSEHQAAMMEEIVYGAVDLAQQLGTCDFIKQPQYIFVDEYQDLNRLEQEFVELLAADSQLLLVVGDPDQSIYSFKFSHPQGIQEFPAQKGVETYRSSVTGRCPKNIAEVANQLLKQADPARQDLLQAEQDGGEVHFVRKETQIEEFEQALVSIAGRLKAGVSAEDILVLVPRRQLGKEFADYANAHREQAGVPEGAGFEFVSKLAFTEAERERILLLGLMVKPDALSHARVWVGLGETDARAPELKLVKEKYGGLAAALKVADPEHFSARSPARALCERIAQLREFLAAQEQEPRIDAVLDDLFPADDPQTASLRAMFDDLREDDDTLRELYSKFVDYMRTILTDPANVRIMTLMNSKGLDADHVYILGCNSGNIPSPNRSTHLSDHEHKQEQRRLLYVGVTRAKESLTISWARLIPFGQSMRHHTAGVRIRRHKGEPHAVMEPSEFLQYVKEITWED